MSNIEETFKIHVDVTQEDINLGIPKNQRFCPIARAINRALPSEHKDLIPHAENVASLKCEAADGLTTVYEADIPFTGCVFMNCFDERMFVKPIEFDLEFTKYGQRL